MEVYYLLSIWTLLHGRTFIQKEQHKEYSQWQCLVTDCTYACGSYSMKYRKVELLSCIPETNVTLCVNSTEKKKKESEVLFHSVCSLECSISSHLCIRDIHHVGCREYSQWNKTHALCQASSRHPAYTYAPLPLAHALSLRHPSVWKHLLGWALENQSIALLKDCGLQAPNGIWELCTHTAEKQDCWKKGWWLCRQLKCILHSTNISPQC